MINKKIIFEGLLIFISFSALILFMQTASAANCWIYTSSATCSADEYCNWRSDSWGGTCEEKGCWNIFNQSACNNAVMPGNKSCNWQAGGMTYACDKLNCWGWSGTNANSCVNNSAGLSCYWSESCYNIGPSSSINCWNITSSDVCSNTSGCSWGNCYEQGCWSYNTNTTCKAAKDPWSGKNCSWENSYCTVKNCGSYSNETSCTSNTDGLGCQWKWNSCQDIQCWVWDFTNENTCENNSYGLSCEWTGSFCDTKGCWNYNNNQTCSQQEGCTWRAFMSTGFCQEIPCWNWDSFKGGNQSQCEENDYGLNCVWSDMPGGEAGVDGWCYREISGISCENMTSERACMDSYYCWWQYNDWSNPGLGGNCTEPNMGGVIFDEWNPGCYIFDMNSTSCNNVLGCNYTDGECLELGDDYGTNITDEGIRCSYINDSSLCNEVPMLSSCCSWQAGVCQENKFSTTCRDELEAPPEGASFCEDYNAFTSQQLCEQISGSPWYMPCSWDNSTERCKFKSEKVFGENESQSLMKIDNQKNCEAAGGKWIVESYCEGNISVPSGRCEYKFNDEDNCDKACFACEWKDSNGNIVNETNAESACRNSKLGFCEFQSNTNAPNEIGFCKAKDAFKKGVVGSCDNNCGDCTYKGDVNNNDTTKTPSYFCLTSKANQEGGGCKWITDSDASQGGYCVNKGEKTCEDSCDRCKTQSDCQNIGRTSNNLSAGSCIWQGDSNTGNCAANIGEDVETCWDGIDNTDDGLIDCQDPSCYADSFCGFVEGNCFGWSDNNTCIENNCEWITDKWGSFCDFAGSQCWKYDINEENCSSNSNCKWNNGTGGAWCEKDWSIADVCMGLNRTACGALTGSGCNWTVDSWCMGQGNGTEWCENNGGWCDYNDFKPKNCWMYQLNSSQCNSQDGCLWKTDQFSQPHCEADNSIACWSYNTNETCTVEGCWWRTGMGGGGYCDSMSSKCWNSVNAESCNSAKNTEGDDICSWNTWMNGCQPVCFNETNNMNMENCGSAPNCVWKQEAGWCEESSPCFNDSNRNDDELCAGTFGCRWKSAGWCDPASGGFSGDRGTGGGGMGTGDCFKYDGNQEFCTNKSIINISCSWKPEMNPKCEVDWSKNCWSYTSIENGCNATNGCWWKNDSYGSFCTNIMDQCWTNESYQNWNNPDGWIGNCTSNNLCTNNSWGGCEPKCFSSNQTTCTSGSLEGKCRWISGWCGGANQQTFANMQAGAPAPLGKDECPEDVQASVDICGFGMKDMGDSYGFGVMVEDLTNSSTCNKETIMSMAMDGGMGPQSRSGGVIGTGTENASLVIYLDTDGETTGGCSLSHDSLQAGYEFRFKYSSYYDTSTSSTKENFAAYICENSDWRASDIKLSAWKKMMCSEIGGLMIAVKKSELDRFPALYNPAKDLRVYAVTIGNNDLLDNPTDEAGPGWTTPGAVDFEIYDAFSYGADIAKFDDILRNGYVKGQDCFNEQDTDGDGQAGCLDWDCYGSSACDGEGVNEEGYEDTRAPQVTGVVIEEYPDAALIMYNTNKPTNGTLELYGADPTCANSTGEPGKYLFPDIGIVKNNTVQAYKLWHYASIYEGAVKINATGFGVYPAPLASRVVYYYKLKVCDDDGKCAVSKCSSFKTPASISSCGYCNFVTRIKTPDGWSVSYDFDRNGVYEHVQGQVCGPNAGVKTNYTSGRKVNVLLQEDGEDTYIEFLNVTLTKTGLNDKVRTIDVEGDVIYDTADNFVGLTSETRDKIVYNLHPEQCRIKVPSAGTCDTLYHCNDAGENCIDKTADAGGVPIDEDECIWQIPYCEFSTYKTSSGGDDSGDDSGDDAGGGGTGGILLVNATANQTANVTARNATSGTANKTTTEDKGGTEGAGETLATGFDYKKILLFAIGVFIIGSFIVIIFRLYNRHRYYHKGY